MFKMLCVPAYIREAFRNGITPFRWMLSVQLAPERAMSGAETTFDNVRLSVYIDYRSSNCNLHHECREM